jgi:hypothetical protein
MLFPMMEIDVTRTNRYLQASYFASWHESLTITIFTISSYFGKYAPSQLVVAL